MAEVARQPASTRDAYAEGIDAYLATLARLLPPAEPAVTARRATAIFALMAGTLQYARTVTDPAAAEHILESGIQAALLLADTPPAPHGNAEKRRAPRHNLKTTLDSDQGK